MSSSAGAPKLPRLTPPDREAGPTAHFINLDASAWWTSPSTLRDRAKLLHQLLLRKKVGTRAEPVRRDRGVLAADAVELAQKERREHVAAAILRLVGWAVLRCNWRTGEIGAYREGRIHYPTRCQIAEGAGFDVLIDAGKRVRCWELDDRLNDAIAAGLLFRLVEDGDGAPSVFKVRDIVWQLAGVALKRKLAAKKAAKKAAAAERAADEAAAEPGKATPAVSAFVGSLVRTLTVEDSPPESRGWGPPPKPKPPS